MRAAIAVLAMVATFTPAVHGTEPKVHSEMLVTASWLQEHLGDADLVVLHVGRDRSEYDAGHLPGARYLALDEIVEQHADSLNDLAAVDRLQTAFEDVGLGDGARVVLYDGAGGLLAARVYFTLDYMGHGDHVSLLDGGLERWKAEGRELQQREAHAARAVFTPHVQEDVVVTTARMREILGQDGYVLLDARPRAEFEGAVKSDGVAKAGHLPGARSLYWKTLLASDALPALRGNAELQQIFAAVGARPEKVVVTYCRTGMQSSFTYFVAKYLGYKGAMYDGSVFEWVNRGGYELVAGQ